MRRVVAVGAGWLLAAVAAALVGVLALSLLGSGITGGQVHVMSQPEAAAALTSASPAPASTASPPTDSPTPGPTSRPPSTRPGPATATPPSTAPSPSSRTSPPTGPTGPTGPSKATVTRALSSPGGTVVARCRSGTVSLVSWTPRQGFEIDDPVRGPGRTAYVTFDSDDLDVHVTVACRDGVPTALTATERDD